MYINPTCHPKRLTKLTCSQIALQPSDCQVPTLHNSLLHIRVNSNTYDANGTAIFSILSLRPSDIFGPRLNLYCQQRRKRYGLDWKIIYRYPAPTPENPTRIRYYDLSWTMTPNHLVDKEYPGMAMKDGDTIHVMEACDPAVNKGNIPNIVDVDVGPQVECQRILIQEGETQVFQHKAVMDAWYNDAEQKLSMYRRQTGELQNTLARERQMLAQAQNVINDLENRNRMLMGQTALLRQGRLPSMVQAFPGYAGATGAQGYGEQPQAYTSQPGYTRQAAPFPFPQPQQQYGQPQYPQYDYGTFGGYHLSQQQQQQGLPPKGMFARSVPVRRNGPVRDAAYKVAAKAEDEEET
jgi:hypothetical protein